MPLPDPRVHAYRPDLAASSLRAIVQAERYVEPSIRQCVRGILPLLATPSADAPQISQIRYGEFLDVFEMRADGFAWVQNRSDRYVGYIPADNVLRDMIADLSFRVSALQTFVYPEPDIKSPPVDELTLGAYVEPDGDENGFISIASGGYLFSKHVDSAADALTPDYVFTAGRLMNTPYMWGGRTPKGIDSAGLIQLALDMAGIETPRDSDQQQASLGRPLERHWRDVPWKRGDLVFFPDCVGIMTGPDHMIHASVFSMSVTVEPLADFIERHSEMEILAVGRPEYF